jgi:hypothetical protein
MAEQCVRGPTIREGLASYGGQCMYMTSSNEIRPRVNYPDSPGFGNGEKLNKLGVRSQRGRWTAAMHCIENQEKMTSMPGTMRHWPDLDRNSGRQGRPRRSQSLGLARPSFSGLAPMGLVWRFAASSRDSAKFLCSFRYVRSDVSASGPYRLSLVSVSEDSSR